MKIFDGNINKSILSFFKAIIDKIPDWITPNLVSFFGGGLSVFVILFFGFYMENLNLVVVLLFILFPFDMIDGMLARRRKSRDGVW